LRLRYNDTNLNGVIFQETEILTLISIPVSWRNNSPCHFFFLKSGFFPYYIYFSHTHSTYPSVCVEGYCCTSSHTVWHTQSAGLPLMSHRPVTGASTCTTHNKPNRQICMPPGEFEPAIPAAERPQTYALNRIQTGIELLCQFECKFFRVLKTCNMSSLLRGMSIHQLYA
jgi:hypothetical protein